MITVNWMMNGEGGGGNGGNGIWNDEEEAITNLGKK
jgi:hypothetical protein